MIIDQRSDPLEHPLEMVRVTIHTLISVLNLGLDSNIYSN